MKIESVAMICGTILLLAIFALAYESDRDARRVDLYTKRLLASKCGEVGHAL
jgi:hypothetical protein